MISNAQLESLLSRREALFAYTKRVSGHNRLTELKPHVDSASRKYSYGIDPLSRYTSLPPDLPPRPELPPSAAAGGGGEASGDADDFRI